MSRWGNARYQEEEGLDFARLFEEKANGVDLLLTKNLPAEAKAKSSKFTQKIIQPKYRHLLYDLIDIAKHQIALDKSVTHAAIETLCSLSEQFLECIFDEQGEQEDEVVQSEKEYPIMSYILRVLTEETVENTGLAYLNKLVSPFIYQRPEQMLQVIAQFGSKNMLGHFGSKSICELISKSIQAESEKEFYDRQKVDIVVMVSQFVRQQHNAAKTEEILESYCEFIESLVEKHEDKYEKFKYANFIKRVSEQSEHFVFLIDKLEQFASNNILKIEILHCIQAFLRMHLPSRAGSKLSAGVEHEMEVAKINENFMKKVVEYFLQNNLQSFVSDSRRQLLSFYKLLKTVVTLDPSSVDQLLIKEFLAQTLDLLQKDSQNNILHNFQRDVIIAGIHQSQKVTDIIRNEIGLQSLLSKVLSDRNSNKCYENQLFLIAEAIKLKSQEKESTVWSQIESTVQSKRSFYSVIIGGNPREDKWDSFDNQIFVPPQKAEIKAEKPKIKQMGTAESNTIDYMTGDEVLSEEDLTYDGKHDHFFDSELPLDSDKSDEGEIRIMINSTEEFQESYNGQPVTIKCESIIIIPAKEEIELTLKVKYGLTLSSKEQ